MNRKLFSLDETAAALAVSRRTIMREADRGYLPTVKIGRRRLVPAVELEKYLAARGSV